MHSLYARWSVVCVSTLFSSRDCQTMISFRTTSGSRNHKSAKTRCEYCLQHSTALQQWHYRIFSVPGNLQMVPWKTSYSSHDNSTDANERLSGSLAPLTSSCSWPINRPESNLSPPEGGLKLVDFTFSIHYFLVSIFRLLPKRSKNKTGGGMCLIRWAAVDTGEF